MKIQGSEKPKFGAVIFFKKGGTQKRSVERIQFNELKSAYYRVMNIATVSTLSSPAPTPKNLTPNKGLQER